MRNLALLLCLLIPLGNSVALAAERRIEGVVRSIDNDGSSITVTTKVGAKEQTETLDVLKKAKISVNGQAAALSTVRKGQKVVILFNSDLEVATKIDATGEGVAEPELTILRELPNSDGVLSAPWPSIDGLTLYWKARKTDEKQPWVWRATRKTRDDLFTDAQRLVPGNDPTVTTDELQMVILDQNLLACSRPAADAAFQRPQKITELVKHGFLAGPCLSSDGLTLYTDMIDLKAHTVEPVRFKRDSRTAKWGERQAVKLSGVPAGKVRFFSVTPDGTYACASIQTEPNDWQFAAIVTFRADAEGTGFGSPKVVEVGGDPVRGKFPRYVAATQELFLARPREGSQLDELVVIKNFDPETLSKPAADLLANKSDDKSNTATRKVLQALNGEWLTIAEEANGRTSSKPEVKQKNRRIVINGNSFAMSRVQDGMSGTYQGKFEIDAKTKSFDWIGKGARGANMELRGIYALDGDTLKLCYKYVKEPGTTRPTQFKTDDKAGTNFVFLTLKRDRD